MDRLYSRAVNQLSGFLGEEFKGSYYRTMYDLQTVNGFGSNFSTINAELVEKTLAYPWSGANFSDRLWKNKNVLIDTMRETLTQGMIRGDSIRDMAMALAKNLKSSKDHAMALVRTETSHIHNTAEIEAYKAGGYEEYEYMASFGEKTCEKCGGLDGQHFKLADIQYGVNFPPVHTNCRCTTVCWDEADEEQKALEGQKTLDYEEWYQKYVEGREQPKLESKDGVAVEPPKQPVPAIPTGENKTAAQTLTTAVYSGIIDVNDNMQRFKEKLNNGLVNTTIDKRNQQNHTLSAAWLNSVKQAFNAIASGKSVTPKSRLFKQYDPQLLADAYCGKGRLEYRVGSNNFDEFVELPFYVGVTFEKSTRKYVKTKVLQIKYSDKGVHLFPTKEMRK